MKIHLGRSYIIWCVLKKKHTILLVQGMMTTRKKKISVPLNTSMTKEKDEDL